MKVEIKKDGVLLAIIGLDDMSLKTVEKSMEEFFGLWWEDTDYLYEPKTGEVSDTNGHHDPEVMLRRIYLLEQEYGFDLGLPSELVKGPPGAPPRAGLQWKESTHRWIRPYGGPDAPDVEEGDPYGVVNVQTEGGILAKDKFDLLMKSNNEIEYFGSDYRTKVKVGDRTIYIVGAKEYKVFRGVVEKAIKSSPKQFSGSTNVFLADNLDRVLDIAVQMERNICKAKGIESEFVNAFEEGKISHVKHELKSVGGMSEPKTGTIMLNIAGVIEAAGAEGVDEGFMIKHTLFHEAGHNWGEHVRFNAELRKKWLTLYSSGRGVVSEYGAMDPDEGFCEAFGFYSTTPSWLKKNFSEAYSYFDALLSKYEKSDDIPVTVREE